MKKDVHIIRGVAKTCFFISVGIGFSQPVFAGEALDELQQNAEFHYKLEGEERIFDGSKQIDQVEELTKVQNLQEGTIIIRARYEGQANSNNMYTLLGMGNAQSDPTKQVAIGAALNPLATRYELGSGLYSSALKSINWADQKWHTIALTTSGNTVRVSMDGQTGTTGADGFYQADKWKGFLTRASDLNSFTIGGLNSTKDNKYPYHNWQGEIDFVTITSAALSIEEADKITQEANQVPEVVFTPEAEFDEQAVGALVGELAYQGGAEDATYTPILKAGVKDNDLFMIEGNQVKVKQVLAPFTTYSLVISTQEGGVADCHVTITTKGTLSGELFSLKEKTEITQPVSHPELVASVNQLESLTIKAQFVQKTVGIGSLLSFSNSQAANEHFHVYANGSTLGYELRGLKDSKDISASASAIRSGGVNTIAFKADMKDSTFKLFANGELVQTKSLDQATYKMMKDLTNGADKVTIGATPRQGNTYPFNGTLLDLQVLATNESDEELMNYTNQTPKEEAEPLEYPHIFEATGSKFFRIPALYTLNDGTVMAAIDARFGGAADSPNNLDTAINFLPTGASEWGEATMPFHFDDYSDEEGYAGKSASYIDPVITQGEDGKIYLAIDAWPTGYGYPNAKRGSGMVTIEGEKYLALTKNGNNIGDWNNFDHYIKDGVVYDQNQQKTAYTVDEKFHLYKDGQALYVKQKSPKGGYTGKEVPMSIFYEDSDFIVYGTSYFFLKTSDDGGKTWSDSVNLNALKNEGERFWGTGPGRGHTIKTGQYKGRIVIPTYDSEDGERASMIYSDDQGKTWQRGERNTMASSDSPGKSSESQLVELPNGTLRLFARGNAGFIGYGDSFDGGHSFTPMKQDKGLAYGGNVMISAINYEGLIDGKPALIVSSPEGAGRNNGIIRIGLINETEDKNNPYTIDWKYKYEVNKGGFVYSCLTQLPNGKIALLWENDPNTTPAIYTEYTIDELKTGKSSLAAMHVLNQEALVPGGNLKVAVQPNSQVYPELSDLENSQLVLNYPDTDIPATALTFEQYDEVKNQLIYTGKVASVTQTTAYEITMAKENQIFTYNGLFTPTAGDQITGEIKVEAAEVPVERLEVALNALTVLKVGKQIEIGTQVTPNNATNPTITWTFDKEGIILIEGDTITAKKAGMVKVTGESTNHKKVTFTIRVTK